MSSIDISNAETPPYHLSEYEALNYYNGLRGYDGPKLVYRTSKKALVHPTLYSDISRDVKLAGVPTSHKLGENRLWNLVREAVLVKILDTHGILLTSVDLVRFSWVEAPKAGYDAADLDFDSNQPGIRYTTSPTIWVGVLPDSTTSQQAYNSAMKILDLLKQHHVHDVEVEFRESTVQLSAGPRLLSPVSDFFPLHRVIDNLTTTLSLPIAGFDSDVQGTLGFYFRVADELFAVTARHVLLKDDEPNVEYNYVGGPHKQVVVMGSPAFTNYLTFLRYTTRSLFKKMDCLKRCMKPGTVQVARDDGLNYQREITAVQEKIEEINAFTAQVLGEWRKQQDRVIGHVVWAPPHNTATSPQSYTQDFCVIKLDAGKFCHFHRNVLSLGPELSFSDFHALISRYAKAPKEFVYPYAGLLKLRDILSEEETRNLNKEIPLWDSVRRVIKRGAATLTTVGGLNGFPSHVHRYFMTGNIDSTKIAIHSHSKDCWTYPRVDLFFSDTGDSGSIVVDTAGRYVALLTSGAGETKSLDISYGTPMYWLWPLILAKFPGADLSWDGEDPEVY